MFFRSLHRGTTPSIQFSTQEAAFAASLIETCKMNDVDPLGYLTDVLTRIVNGHPNSDMDQLMRKRPAKPTLPRPGWREDIGV